MNRLNQFFLVSIILLISTAQSYAKERIALVIGNSKYLNVSPLANPGNDANLMASTLESVGFEVILVPDANISEFRKALTNFGRRLRERNADGLFYYAGHGVQLGGENFLIPIDSNILDQSELSWQALRVNDVLRIMERDGTNVNIVILDACRNNPFPSSSRSASTGLARIDASKGTYIAYATAPGEVALDGAEANSPYTLALTEFISTTGLTIEETFKATRQEVLKQTNGRQTPWEASSITGTFHFIAPNQESVASLQQKLKQQKALIKKLKQTKMASNRPVGILSDEDVKAGEECNRLASSAHDKNVVGDGVEYLSLQNNSAPAIKMCERAVRGYPKDDRYKYQLARSYLASGDKNLEAAHWMRKAAESYYPAAMNGLGVLLNLGRGVAKDSDESFSWIIKAAEKGYVPAMTNLGVAYAYGGGTSVDAFQATKWLRKSVSKNDPYAKMHFGYHYAQGNKALVKDVAESLKLLDEAINAGVSEAVYLKLQIYGFAILDGDADGIRKKLRDQSQKLGIRGAFVGEYLSSKKLPLLESAVSLTPRHELPRYEPLYTKSVYLDSDLAFRSGLDWIVNSKNYPKSHREFLSSFLKQNP